MELGDTPVERSVAWFIEALRGGRKITEADVVGRFTPRFLEAVPPAVVLDVIGQRQTASELTIEVVELVSPYAMQTIIVDEDGRSMVRANVEEEPPHRFNGLLIQPAEQKVADWVAIRAKIARHDRVESKLDGAITEQITAARDKDQIPGLVAGIVRDGVLVHRQVLGVGDLDAPGPLWTDDVFRAGSISKVITALSVLRLVEQDQLALDDPVSKHLRAFSVKPFASDDPPITIRHVLTHTAGFPRDPGHDGESLAELVGGELRAISPPGKQHLYSNIGFGMLGQLIEDLTGNAYGAFVDEHVFTALGMTKSSISRDGSVATVRGYRVQSEGLADAPPESIVDEGAGALCSTIEDLALLATAVCDSDPRLARSDLLREALSSQTKWIEAAGRSQGLGFVLWETAGARVVWHNGGLNGWKAAWYVAPGARTSVILMANRLDAQLDELARAALKSLL